MLTLDSISHFISLHANLAYLFICLGMLIEGEVIVITSGIFVHLGSLNLLVTFFSIVLGCCLKAGLGYSFGSYLRENHSHLSIVRRVENRVNYFLPNFSKRPFWAIFLSGFLILSMNLFTHIYSGYKKVKLHIFIKATMSSIIVWSCLMLFLGYFFSYTALSVSHDIRKFLLVILICFISFFILEKVGAFMIELFETKDKNK